MRSKRFGYVELGAELMVARQMRLCEQAMERSQTDQQCVFDAVRAAHLALTCAMVVALEGSAGIGAMTERAAAKTTDWRSGSSQHGVYPPERTMPFSDLLAALQMPGRIEYGSPVIFSHQQRFYLARLNELRDDVEHPKYTHFSHALHGIDLAVLTAAAATPEVMNLARHRYDNAQLAQAAHSRDAIVLIAELSQPRVP